MVPQYLQLQQADGFFKIVLFHFKEKLPVIIGNQILLTLEKLFIRVEFVNIFNKGNYLKFLPFNQPEFDNIVLNLLYIIAQNCFSAITNEIWESLFPICQRNPQKCLSIIAIYTKSYIENQEKFNLPFAFSDLLFGNELFLAPTLVEKHFSIISFLISSSPIFCKEKISQAWKSVLKAMDNGSKINNSILSTGLYTLVSLIESDYQACSSFEFPYSAVKTALQNQKFTIRPALSLLLRILPSYQNKQYISDLINILVELTSENQKATLVLLKLAQSEEIASVFLMNTKWMIVGLPQWSETLRLFGLLLSHSHLKDEISKNVQVPLLFANLLQIKEHQIIPVLTTFLRRISINEELVHSLLRNGFIKKFLERVDSIEENDTSFSQIKHSACLMTDSLIKSKYQPALFQCVNSIMKIIQCNNTEICIMATLVAGKMCQFKQCASKFRDLGLEEFFSKQINNKELQKYARKTLQEMNETLSEF